MSNKSQIRRNAKEIAGLHRLVHETAANRGHDEASWQRWEEACRAFHDQYEELAFPGGTRSVRERLRGGDTVSIEYALDFLEVRPYFIRSGYLYQDLMRVLRNCPLTTGQRKRYDLIRARFDEYRSSCRRQPSV